MKFTSIFLTFTCVMLLLSCKDVSDGKGQNSGDHFVANKDFDYTNDLVDETSPYLLQHAHNPVDWKPWGDKAFELAKERNSLIILSIGYSTCHWCHVMEEESFEDIAVAQLMNESYVSIKVDREERPDVDIVYQTALELVQESGGWPLNAILLPDGKPVYLGTYHDKENWKALISRFALEYKNNPDKMAEYARLLTNGVQEVYRATGNNNQVLADTKTIENGVLKWSETWDTERGGDMAVQKFISPARLNFLLDFAFLSTDIVAKKHLKYTLDAIMLGGIHDHVGGGFYRYSTDSEWRIPHFEKMLYDNAQIVSLYAKAYRAFKDPAYLNVVETTLDFIDREMKGVKGGYISALDADSNGEEGAFYVWSLEELKFQLGDDFSLFSKLYAIEKEWEWEKGRYILFKQMTNTEFSKENSISESKLEAYIKKWNQILLKSRNKRPVPKKDDKIITSWNALLIEGFIEAYKATGKEAYLTNAKNTFQFLLENSFKDENLVHSYKEGSKQKEVFLEDYAFMAKSALAIYKETFDLSYLELAKKMNGTVLEKYSDETGLFRYSATNELITKIVRTADGVIPSANAIMAHNLMELGHLDYNTQFMDRSNKMISLMSTSFLEQTQNYGQWGVLLLNQAYPYFEIVVVGPNANRLINELNTYFIPNSLIVGSKVPNTSALFKDRFVKDGTFIYICQNQVCKLPVQTTQDAIKQLANFGFPILVSNNDFLPM